MLKRVMIGMAAALALACGGFASAEIRVMPVEDHVLTALHQVVDQALVATPAVADTSEQRVASAGLDPASLRQRMRAESAGFVFNGLQRERIERDVPC